MREYHVLISPTYTMFMKQCRGLAYRSLYFMKFYLDLANGSFGLGSGRVKFGSGKVRVTQMLFGFGFRFGSS